MPETPTVAELFQSASNRLRVEFESYREGSFHSGQMGAEVETVLRNFLTPTYQAALGHRQLS